MDKEALFRPRLPEADVDVPGIGTVRVRGLSRAEAMLAQRAKDKGIEHMERVILAMAMVDPPMTEAEVGRWQKASQASEMEPVVNKVNELSGLREGADKAAYKSVRDESDAGVRVLPGPEVGDDGDGAARADVV